MSRINHLKEINDFLTHFAMTLESENSNGEFSKNRHAEDIFLPILEYVIGKKLRNVNSLNGVSNYPAIDLISEDGKIGIQVTSTGSKRKIEKTLNTYAKNTDINLEELYIFIIGTKEKTRSLNQSDILKVFNKEINFVPERHIIDRVDLYKKINSLDEEIIEYIHRILERNFSSINSYKREQPDKYLAISFDEKDIEFVNKLVSELLNRQIMIYSKSERLEDYLRSHKHKNLFKLLIRAKDLPDQVEHCAIFITKSYHDSKLRLIGTECEIVQFLDNRGEQLIPIIYEERIGKIKKFDIGKKSILINGKNIDKTIKKIDQQLQGYVSKFDNYKDISSILKKFRSNIKIIDAYSDPKEKIGYQLFGEPNSIREDKTETFYLYLFKDAAITKTAKHFKLKHLNKFNSSKDIPPIAVLIPREKRLKKGETRKENVKEEFNADKIFFLDEFILDKCSPIDFKQKIERFEIGEFIEPFIKLKESREDVGFDNDCETEIEKWIENPYTPAMVLTGSGGIGKTTLAKHIANCHQETYSNSRVIFIQSDKIVNAINKSLEKEEFDIDIYRFYEVSTGVEDLSSVMDKDMFRYNFDNGNIILIIDGIDEIFSRVKEFNFPYFLSSIRSYLSGIGNGKVLITCRDIWWDYIDDLDEDDLSFMAMYEVCQFDDHLARKYFEKKRYTGLTIEKLIEYAKVLSNNQSEKNEYLPFVLNLIHCELNFKIFCKFPKNRKNEKTAC